MSYSSTNSSNSFPMFNNWLNMSLLMVISSSHRFSVLNVWNNWGSVLNIWDNWASITSICSSIWGSCSKINLISSRRCIVCFCCSIISSSCSIIGIWISIISCGISSCSSIISKINWCCTLYWTCVSNVCSDWLSWLGICIEINTSWWNWGCVISSSTSYIVRVSKL